MHEFGVVEALVKPLLEQLEHEHITRVNEVHFQRGSAFSEIALRQAFRALTVDTPLEQAKLMIKTVNLKHRCSCGHEQVITTDDLIGHMFICPVCGTIREVDEAHELELLKVVAEGDEVAQHPVS
jgi:Zn finger protein HypA/HybF involved in hydrogenase expression